MNGRTLETLDSDMCCPESGAFTFIGPQGASVNDFLILSSNAYESISNFSVMSLAGSDHLPITFQVLGQEATSQLNETSKSTHCLRLNSDRLKRYLNSDYGSRNLEEICQIESASTAFQLFYDIIENCVTERRLKRHKPNSWYNSECEDLDKQLNHLTQALKMSDNNYNEKWKDYKVLKEFTKKSKEEIKSKYIDEQIKMLKSLHPNSKEFWSFFNPKKKTNATIPVELLEQYFKKLFFETNSSCLTLDDPSLYLTDPILDDSITFDEIQSALNQCKLHSSPGCDNITYKIICNHLSHLKYIILHLFNSAFNEAYIPPEWKISKIIPIFKGNNPDLPENYRPINLLSCLYKLYSRVLTNRLEKWCDLHDILRPNQFGFRRKLSTMDACFTLYTMIQKYTKRRTDCLMAAFVDFKAAFDKINRNKLKHKLKNLGVSTKFLNSVVSTLSDSKFFISCPESESKSNVLESNIGVKQGDVISPLLFSLYVNDLEEAIGHDRTCIDENCVINLILYADDAVLIANNKTNLEIMLKKLSQYCKENILTVNIAKTKCMVFVNKKSSTRQNAIRFSYDGHPIETVESFKYLGVLFDEKVNFSANLKSVKNKCIAAIKNITNSNFPYKHLTNEQLINLYEAKILSIIRYSAPLWGFRRMPDLESISLKFYKSMLHLPTYTPTLLLRQEFGIFTIYSTTILSCISYLWKLTFTQHPFLISCLNFYKSNVCQVNWYDEVLNTFREYDMTPQPMVDSIGMIPKSLFFSSIKSQSQEVEKTNLKKAIAEKYSQPYIVNSDWNHFSLYSSVDLDFDLKRILIMLRTNSCFVIFSKTSYVDCPICHEYIFKKDTWFHFLFACEQINKGYAHPTILPEAQVLFEFLCYFTDILINPKMFCQNAKKLRINLLSKFPFIS